MLSSGDDGVCVIKRVKKKVEKERMNVFVTMPDMVPCTQSPANMCQRNE